MTQQQQRSERIERYRKTYKMSITEATKMVETAIDIETQYAALNLERVSPIKGPTIEDSI
jgi:hypothetical protein